MILDGKSRVGSAKVYRNKDHMELEKLQLKVKKLVEALELIVNSGTMYKLGELVPYGCEPLGVAHKALAEFGGSDE